MRDIKNLLRNSKVLIVIGDYKEYLKLDKLMAFLSLKDTEVVHIEDLAKFNLSFFDIILSTRKIDCIEEDNVIVIKNTFHTLLDIVRVLTNKERLSRIVLGLDPGASKSGIVILADGVLIYSCSINREAIGKIREILSSLATYKNVDKITLRVGFQGLDVLADFLKESVIEGNDFIEFEVVNEADVKWMKDIYKEVFNDPDILSAFVIASSKGKPYEKST